MSDGTDTNTAKNEAAASEAAKPAAAEPTARPVEKSGGGGAVFFAVFLSVAASGALVVGSPYWTPFAEKYAEKIITLPNPLKAVQAELARLSGAVAAADAKTAALATESAKLKEQTSAATGASAGVKAATLALAGGQLRTKLAAGETFQFELAAVRAVAKGDAEVNALLDGVAPLASVGVPTRAVLRDGFPAAVAAVVAAEAEGAAKSAAGWFGGVSALVNQLGYVLHVTPAPEGGVHAVARQARARLAAGDLAGAVEEFSALPEPRPADADEWLTAAKARVAADKADGALTTLILSRLNAAK